MQARQAAGGQAWPREGHNRDGRRVLHPPGLPGQGTDGQRRGAQARARPPRPGQESGPTAPRGARGWQAAQEGQVQGGQGESQVSARVSTGARPTAILRVQIRQYSHRLLQSVERGQ
eukprot:6732733-Pyramimonas_sp.AAC.1